MMESKETYPKVLTCTEIKRYLGEYYHCFEGKTEGMVIERGHVASLTLPYQLKLDGKYRITITEVADDLSRM